MDVKEAPIELEHGAMFSHTVHLEPFDTLFPAIEGMEHAESFPLGKPVHPAESDGGLVVGPITLRGDDADLVGLEEQGSVDPVAC